MFVYIIQLVYYEIGILRGKITKKKFLRAMLATLSVTVVGSIPGPGIEIFNTCHFLVQVISQSAALSSAINT